MIIKEIIDAAIMTIAVGYIFMRSEKFTWTTLIHSSMMIAPTIILHELGHKFIAMLFGLQATFNAAYGWLAIGVALKVLHSPILLFVPAFVQITCGTTCEISPLQSALIAFAGPGVNLVFYLISLCALKNHQMNEKWHTFWIISKQLNLLLFIINMLPIPGVDGLKIYEGIYNAL